MAPSPPIPESTDESENSRLQRLALRVVLGAVVPIFVLSQFLTQGMTFPASLITLLTILSLVFTAIAIDVSDLKAALTEQFEGEE